MELALAGRRLYDDLIGALDDFEFRPSGGMIYFFEDEHDLFPRFVAGGARGLARRAGDGDAARAAVRSCRMMSPVPRSTRWTRIWIRPS